MKKMKSDSKFKPKLIVLKRRRPNGLRNFKIRVKFKQQHSVSLKLHLTVILIRPKLRKLQPSSERVAAAGQEIELPKFELPGEAQLPVDSFCTGALSQFESVTVSNSIRWIFRFPAILEIFVNLSPIDLVTKKDGIPKSRILGQRTKTSFGYQ